MTRTLILLLPLTLATTAHAEPDAVKKCDVEAFAEDYVDAFNSHDADTVRDLYDDDFSVDSPYGTFDADGWTGLTASAWYAFPDMEWSVVQVVAEGDRFALEYAFAGTFTNDFLGYTAAGQSVVGRGMEINELDPKTCEITATWNYSDASGFLAQLQ